MPDRPRINDELVHLREVRVVDERGEQLGVISAEDALHIARARGLDLVEVNPKASPSVCKIMDFARLKHEARVAAARRHAAEAPRRAAEAVRLARFSVGVHGMANDQAITQEYGLSLADVRDAILATPLGRDTEFRLALPGRPVIVVRSTCAEPTACREPGEFAVFEGDKLIKKNATRQDVVQCIEQLLA